MALTESDLQSLRELLITSIREHACRFQMTDEQASKLSKIADVFEELGEGDITRGLRLMRDNHLWLTERREEMEPEYTENHTFVKEVRSGVAAARSAGIKAVVAAVVTALLAGMVLLLQRGR